VRKEIWSIDGSGDEIRRKNARHARFIDFKPKMTK
jgi:hypothetical protein